MFGRVALAGHKLPSEYLDMRPLETGDPQSAACESCVQPDAFAKGQEEAMPEEAWPL